MSVPDRQAQTGSSKPGLTVRACFALDDEQAARKLAAQLVDRAHELANLPECECDVDVDVEWVAPSAPAGGSALLDTAPEPRFDR